MTQIERIPAHNVTEWSAAVDAVQHNELLGAVMSVGTEEDMRRALVQPIAEPYAPPVRTGSPDVLRPSLVSPDLSKAAIIAYNASVDEKDQIPINISLPDLSIYQRNGTGFHYDGYGNDPSDPERKKRVLEPNIQVLGRVAISLVRFETLDPSEMMRLGELLTDEYSWLDQGTRLLKQEHVSSDNTYIAQPGDISVFSGFADLAESRQPVGHQFVSLGKTDQERSQRTSSIVYAKDFSRLTTEQSKEAA